MATFKDKMNVSILTDYPGVVTGTLANNTARGVNRTAINAAIADATSARKMLLVPPGNYEIHGGPIIMASNGAHWFGSTDVQLIQYQLDQPVVHIGPPFGTAGQTIQCVFDGAWIKYSAAASAGGNGFEITGAFMSRFSNLEIGDPYNGASGAVSVPRIGLYCDPTAGTIPCFSCIFSHIRIKNFSAFGFHQFRDAYDAATGNHYENIYVSAGGAGDVRDITGNNGIPVYMGSLAQSSFNQFNVEWSTAQTAMHLEVCRGLAFQSLNIEGVTLKNGSLLDSGVVSMYQSQASINGCMIQNCTVNSANNVQNPSMFRLQSNSWVSLNNFYPILMSKTGITNLALARNWDGAGNSGCGMDLVNCNLGDNDQLDLIDGITFSAGNDGPAFGLLSDFNNNSILTTSDANSTQYAYRRPGIILVPATSARTLILGRALSATNATRIPRGVTRRVKASSSSTVQVQNYNATNLGAAIASGAFADFYFNGTDWIRM